MADSLLFLCHETAAKQEAFWFAQYFRESGGGSVFLSSDATSIPSMDEWRERVHAALESCTAFAMLITRSAAYQKPWMCFEYGFARARNVPRAGFIFGSTSTIVTGPLEGAQLTDTGNTERWVADLERLGAPRVRERQTQFAQLFRQDPDPTKWVLPPDRACMG